MQAKNFKQVAQISLDERWNPVSKAKSIKEMKHIIRNTKCSLCRYTGLTCGECPLDDIKKRGTIVCAIEFVYWNGAIANDNFPEAQKQAFLLVKRLEKIAEV